MSQNKTEKKAPVGKRLLIKKLPPDHPIYTRGFVIGGKNSSHFPENTQAKILDNEVKKSDENLAHLFG